MTAITTHVPNSNKLIVLYQSGSAIKTNLQLGALPTGWGEASSVNGSIAPTTDTNFYTQPSGTQHCSYVAPSFWAINTTGR